MSKATLPFIVDNGVLVINNQVPFRLDAIQTVQYLGGNCYVTVFFEGVQEGVRVGTDTPAQAKWLQSILAEWMAKQPRRA